MDYLGDYETHNRYEVADCEKELRLLKMLDKKNLEVIFSQFDKDKLAYIVQMMNADLIQSEVTDFERLDKHTRQVIKKEDGSVTLRRVISPVVNDMKMELCLRFNDTKPMKLSVGKKTNDMKIANDNTFEVVSKLAVLQQEEVSNITLGVGSEVVKRNMDNSYGLNITTELVQLSMSKAGCPYDNAAMESFYGTFKAEFSNMHVFQTDEQLNKSTMEYVYGYYNHIRPHSLNGYMTPFEKRYS